MEYNFTEEEQKQYDECMYKVDYEDVKIETRQYSLTSSVYILNQIEKMLNG